jgi:hypothetical protein
MDKVAALSTEERKELFSETAVKMETTSAIIEKDFWVVWTLDKIFADERLNKILMFKGGTSLSKVFNLIGRFSEDIDLILDWREVTKEDPEEERSSKSKQVKFNAQVNEDAKEYISDVILPVISTLLSPLCKCQIDEEDAFNINITYPASFDDPYLKPQILLEIGPLASWLPSDSFEISAYAAQKFPTVFDRSMCKVNAIVAKRTFWEKATILHQETNRAEAKPLPPRYSRHYYDLAIMAQSEVKDEALSDLELLKQVVNFKQKFYPAAWAKFEDAKPGTLKLLPEDFRMDALAKDYNAMGHMIFDKQLSFEEIVETLAALEEEINVMEGSR